jgi:hypothetical protein
MCLLWSTNWVFISQKTAFFIVTTVKTSNLTWLSWSLWRLFTKAKVKFNTKKEHIYQAIQTDAYKICSTYTSLYCWNNISYEGKHFRNNPLRHNYKKPTSVALSPRANYTDWATATCRRNLVSTFVDRGVSRGQRGGSPAVVNLSFLDRSRYFSFK